jgi:hypothetical protein
VALNSESEGTASRAPPLSSPRATANAAVINKLLVRGAKGDGVGAGTEILLPVKLSHNPG